MIDDWRALKQLFMSVITDKKMKGVAILLVGKYIKNTHKKNKTISDRPKYVYTFLIMQNIENNLKNASCRFSTVLVGS